MAKISKWHVLIGGFIAYLFDAMEIILLSLSLSVISKDLGFSINEAAMLATATLLGIGVSSITTGWYSDNFGRRNALLASLITFGVLTAVISNMHNLYVLIALRFLSGLGLGGVWSIVSTYVVETWPPYQRARATSFVVSAFPIGAMVAAFGAKFLLPEWRTMFLWSGVAVILPVLYIYFWVPESPTWIAQKAQRCEKTERVSIKEIFVGELRHSTIFGTLAASLALIGYWGSSTWLPTYLVQDRGLSLSAMAGFMAMLNLGNFFGLNFFGYVGDKLGKRRSIILSLLLTAMLVPIYLFTSNSEYLFWIGPVYAFFLAFPGIFGAYFSELYPTRVRTMGAGFCFNAGRGVAALAPILLSGIATYYSLAAGLLVCAGFFVLSALVILTLPESGKTQQQFKKPVAL
ncbi:MFS transporter [Pseudomonas frederiksbergensis]|uniref:MFS transporter n=1 Tax=Pseudomonas frederiksbergensis TaxID=104087 RepID=UPI001980EB02|nr:MFS transporter [Pseudomonas frederiksbergensis]MBN3864901.1 MFS transporter [Pseudomonas frederiksbergensis]